MLRLLQKTFAVLTTPVVGAAFVLGVSAASATTACAQQSGARERGVFSVEANPFRGSIGYARATSPQWEFGGSLGFGFPQIDLTLFRGDRDDFRDYAHLAAFVRRNYGTRAVLEMGARIGVADYQRCEVSDCWPGLYFGPSVLFAIGGEHVKVGPRVTLGAINSPSRDVAGFASVSPLNVFLSWRF